MTQESNTDLPVIKVPVHCCMVKKAIVCEITNASQYEYEATLNFLRKNDKAFAAEYELWKMSWSLSEKLALRFVTFLYPGYQIWVVLG